MNVSAGSPPSTPLSNSAIARFWRTGRIAHVFDNVDMES
jgi:hypothetical protein